MEEQEFLLPAPHLEPVAENRFLGSCPTSSQASSDTVWDMGQYLPAHAPSKLGL